MFKPGAQILGTVLARVVSNLPERDAADAGALPLQERRTALTDLLAAHADARLIVSPEVHRSGLGRGCSLAGLVHANAAWKG